MDKSNKTYLCKYLGKEEYLPCIDIEILRQSGVKIKIVRQNKKDPWRKELPIKYN
jgi:hypothetical protein